MTALEMASPPLSVSRRHETSHAQVPQENASEERHAPVQWVTALLVFLAALVYFLLFHRYGFFLQDEGAIAYQALRVSTGQVPYSDFQTAYTPAGYYLHALLFDTFGTNLVVLRVSASFACAATAALLFLAATHVLPSAYTLLPSLLYVVLEDQDSGGLVVHTLPYVARYITTLWALSLCLTLAHTRRPRRALAAALGLVTAAIAGFKHTAGIYNAWAVGLSLIVISLGYYEPTGSKATSTESRSPDEFVGELEDGPWQQALGALPFAFLLAVLAALPLLFGSVASSDWRSLVAFCLPLAALVALVLHAGLPWRAHREKAGRIRLSAAAAGSYLCWFGVTAAVLTALWVAYFGAAAGFGVIGQRLIFDGPAVARSYAIPFPSPEGLAIGVALLVLAAIGARTLVQKGLIESRSGARTFALTSGALVLLGVLWIARLPWHALTWNDWLLPLTYAGRQMDNLAFYLAGIIVYAFLWRLCGWLRRQKPLDLALVCWIHALCQFLLAYPRLDVAHLYEGVTILLIPGTVVLERTTAFFRRAAGPGRARWLPVAVVCALGIVGITKLAPRVAAQVQWRHSPALAHRTAVLGPRGGLYGTVDEDAGWIASLDRTIAFINKRIPAEKPIFTYPALSGIYFLSGRNNPSHMDYFHQGFGEGRDELEVITALEKTRTPVVVVMTDYSFDPMERDYFPMLKDYIRRHFVQTVYFAPYRVLERVLP